MLRKLHRITAVPIAAFIVLHILNHVALFWGHEAHLEVQRLLRPIYRNPIVEPLMIAAFALQIWLGLRLILRRGWPRLFWSRVQVLSGAALAFFLVQHIPAALYTRWAKPDIDTTIYWAAAVVSRWEFGLYFAPYYFVGMSALFWHAAAIAARKPAQKTHAIYVGLLGSIFAFAFVIALAGGIFPLSLPDPYKIYLDTFWQF